MKAPPWQEDRRGLEASAETATVAVSVPPRISTVNTENTTIKHHISEIEIDECKKIGNVKKKKL